MNKRFVIIDANAALYRAYFTKMADLCSYSGEPTKVTYNFMLMLLGIIDSRADYIAVCFDAPRETLFRTKLFPEYKGQRPPKPVGFGRQRKRIRQILKLMKVPTFEVEGYEADDLIATIANKFAQFYPASSTNIEIMSSDKDLFPLLDWTAVTITDLHTNRVITAPLIKHKYGIHAHQFEDYLMMVGDSADNVKGAAGIGDKTAAKLLKRHVSLKRIIQLAQTFSPAIKAALLSDDVQLAQRVIPLKYNVPVPDNFEDYRVDQIKVRNAVKVFKELGFRRWAKLR